MILDCVHIMVNGDLLHCTGTVWCGDTVHHESPEKNFSISPAHGKMVYTSSTIT